MASIALTRQDSMSSCASDFRQDHHAIDNTAGNNDDLGYETTIPQQYNLRGPPPPHMGGSNPAGMERSESKYTDLNAGDDFSLAGECDNISTRSVNRNRPGRRASLSAAIELTSSVQTTTNSHKKVPIKRNFSGGRSRAGRRNSLFGGSSAKEDKHSSQDDAADADDDQERTQGWFPEQPNGKKTFRTRSGNLLQLRRASMSSAAVEQMYSGEQEPEDVNPQMFSKRNRPGRSKSNPTALAAFQNNSSNFSNAAMPKRTYSGESGSSGEGRPGHRVAPSRITRPKRGNRRASMSAMPPMMMREGEQRQEQQQQHPHPHAGETVNNTNNFNKPGRSRSFDDTSGNAMMMNFMKKNQQQQSPDRPKFLQPHETETSMYDLAVATAAAAEKPQRRAGRRSSLGSFSPFGNRRRTSSNGSSSNTTPPPRTLTPPRSVSPYQESPLPSPGGEYMSEGTPTTSNRKAVNQASLQVPSLNTPPQAAGSGGLGRLSMTPRQGSAIGYELYGGSRDDDDSEEEEQDGNHAAPKLVSEADVDSACDKEEKKQEQIVVEEVDVDQLMETASQVDPDETAEQELELDELMPDQQGNPQQNNDNNHDDPSPHSFPPSSSSNRESQQLKPFNILGHQSTGDWGRDVEDIMNGNSDRPDDEFAKYDMMDDDNMQHDYETEQQESEFDDTQLYAEDYSEMAWKESQPRAFESMEFINMQNLMSSAKSTQGLYLPNFLPAHGCTNASDFIIRCFVARLRTGLEVTKHSRSRWGKSQLRMLHILPSGFHITWIPTTEEEIQATKKRPTKLDLTKCREVRHAWSQDPKSSKYTGTATLRAKCKEGTANRSFSLIFDKRSVDFTAYNVDQCKIMMEGFSALCFRLQMAKLELQADDNESLISGVSGIDFDDDASSTASLTATNASSPWGL